MKSKREHLLPIADRTFKLQEFNGKRKSQLDDYQDQSLIAAKKLDAAESIEEKREIRKEIANLNRETYRLFLIPVDPPERTPDEWLDDNMTEGYFMNVVAVLNGALNRYEDVSAVGKSIAERLAPQPAETNGLSPGPVFAAH